MSDANGAGIRSERDSFGAIDVPSEHHWGAQTARSLQFFDIGEEEMFATRSGDMLRSRSTWSDEARVAIVGAVKKAANRSSAGSR
jgi:fumarate hydratase class II